VLQLQGAAAGCQKMEDQNEVKMQDWEFRTWCHWRIFRSCIFWFFVYF